jgi:tetratricopeptide (TPR) repeat protein
MLALLFDWLAWSGPLGLLFLAFAVWMLVDAIRRGEWLWAAFIFLFAPLNAPLYYFLVYRAAAGPATGFELPGARTRARIKELEDRIHHLDNARDHAELADVRLEQGKLDLAEAGYRAALERDPDDPDVQAHYGLCLLRLGRPAEALTCLERIVRTDPAHDFGHTQMALAETYAALGRPDDALATWQQVLERHTYARARVQLAELHLARHQTDAAREVLREVVADDAHAPAFQRQRERVWVQKARALLRQTGGD